MTDEEAAAALEAVVRQQPRAVPPWVPVTDYSFTARQTVEGIHPQLIKDVFHPRHVLDCGAGPGHLVMLLRALGVEASGIDVMPHVDQWVFQEDLTHLARWPSPRADLVVCREVLEHLPLLGLRRAIFNLARLTWRYVYVTTRFAQSPAHVLSVETHDDLDPSHISMLTKPFVRALFILEGCRSRPDLEAKMDHQHKGRVLVFDVDGGAS